MTVELREWQEKDAKALSQILTNKKVQDNLLDGLPYPYEEKYAKEYFADVKLQKEAGTQYNFAVVADGKVAGNIGVRRKDNVHYRIAELGYYMGEDFWGKGICTKAIKKICQFVFENTDVIRIFSQVYDFNEASCKVLEKSGFILEGNLRSHAVKNGEIIDVKMYGFVKGEDF